MDVRVVLVEKLRVLEQSVFRILTPISSQTVDSGHRPQEKRDMDIFFEPHYFTKLFLVKEETFLRFWKKKTKELTTPENIFSLDSLEFYF